MRNSEDESLHVHNQKAIHNFQISKELNWRWPIDKIRIKMNRLKQIPKEKQTKLLGELCSVLHEKRI